MKKVKKGMTILGIVIGLAIIGIMLVPLASGLLTSVTANKKAEETQQAKLLGQQVVEKLKVENKITNGEEIDFHDKKIKILNGTPVTGTSYMEYEVKSDGEINGYEVKGKIKEESVTSINGDSYEDSGIKERIGLFIHIDKDATGKIQIKYMEGSNILNNLEDMLEADAIQGMQKIIIDNNKLNLSIILKDTAIELKSDCNKIKQTISGQIDGVILVYVNGIGVHSDLGPTVNIDAKNELNSIEEIQILRDISVKKEDFIKGLKVNLQGKFSSYNNVLYDSTDSNTGLYTVDLEVIKKGKVVETTSAQFYLKR